MHSLTTTVRFVPVVSEDLVPEHALAASRQPRVQTFDRLLHLQARVQAQVLRGHLRGMHGLFLRTPIGSGHEQAVPVYTRWTEPRAAHSGRPEERMYMWKPHGATTDSHRSTVSASHLLTA
jgi:hypothetical protein